MEAGRPVVTEQGYAGLERSVRDCEDTAGFPRVLDKGELLRAAEFEGYEIDLICRVEFRHSESGGFCFHCQLRVRTKSRRAPGDAPGCYDFVSSVQGNVGSRAAGYHEKIHAFTDGLSAQTCSSSHDFACARIG